MATALTVSETNSINAATSFYSNIGSKSIAKYVRSMCTMSKSTAYEYYTRLTNFDAFLFSYTSHICFQNTRMTRNCTFGKTCFQFLKHCEVGETVLISFFFKDSI
jgi:hypothetical protein